MALSRKPRHWIALPLAIAWTVLAIMQFADFSGEPAPRWRELSLMILAPGCLCLMMFNLLLDGRAAKEDSADQNG